MPRAADQTGKARKSGGKGLVIILALVAGAVGFGLAFYGAPLVMPLSSALSESTLELDAGTFPVALPAERMQLVAAKVTVRPDGSAPEGPNQLHDAVLVLIADATALPLLQDGRGSLDIRERIVLSMAPATAPWLVGIELEPADQPTPPGAETDEAGEAGH